MRKIGLGLVEERKEEILRSREAIAAEKTTDEWNMDGRDLLTVMSALIVMPAVS